MQANSFLTTLFAALALLSTGVRAEWLFIGTSSQADFYIQASTIRKEGDSRQVLELLDLKHPDPKGNRSYIALYEYVCKTEQARILRSACFEGPMGGGTKTDECHEPGEWSQPREGSAAITKLRMVCEK